MTALEPQRGPLDALALFSELPAPCLLHSADASHPIGRYSYLSADPVSFVDPAIDAWPLTAQRIRATIRADPPVAIGLPPMQGGWMGWLPYELGEAFGLRTEADQPDGSGIVALALYDWVIAWDHQLGTCWLVSSGVDPSGQRDRRRGESRATDVVRRWKAGSPSPRAREARIEAVTPPRSDFSEDEYLRAVAQTVAYVRAGDIYQANISQRFVARFDGDELALHRRIVERSPAPMSAFARRGDTTVISASPERFLRYDAGNRSVETRPIKGTRPRAADPATDRAYARALEASEKDRAENIMIVDLMRNDLSRVCSPGTVRAPTLCAVESHAAVHHLVSTVVGRLRPECDALDLLAAAFPGGSITGAPKLRAMEIISEIEPVARGVYSGSIGWIGLDGSMDTSIAIRTVVIHGHTLSFHAGGGITALSEPLDELQETLDKTRAIRMAIRDTP